MAADTENGGGRRGSRWRIAAWTLAALVLLLPLVAMQFTNDVNWDRTDFAFAGALVVGTGVTFELAVRRQEIALIEPPSALPSRRPSSSSGSMLPSASSGPRTIRPT